MAKHQRHQHIPEGIDTTRDKTQSHFFPQRGFNTDKLAKQCGKKE